ncbi:MAG: hypothetical protein J6T46_15140, partial [Victivallales bacterium]|nr:hypothetical protein [Victivallales bacterium]
MITEKYFIYDFAWMCFQPLKDGMRFRDGFVFRFKLNALPKTEGVLFEVPGSLRITTRDIPNDAAEGGWERAENFRSLPEADGHCHVMEIE